MSRLMVVLVTAATSFATHAFQIDPRVEREFLKLGGKSKSLDHMKCFLNKYRHTRFELKNDDRLGIRCSEIENSDAVISINKPNVAVIVDYTAPSNRRRFFVLNLNAGPKERAVESYFVSHGRFMDTPFDNVTPGKSRNTVKWMKYYGNVPDTNATSTGFYITGAKYQGAWVGPQGDKWSLIVHGLEKDVNDNACSRAVVIHGNSAIKEKGKRRGVKKMSSGCYMLDYDVVNKVVDRLRGEGDFESPDSVYNGGAALLTFGPREAAMDSNHYCETPPEELFRGF